MGETQAQRLARILQGMRNYPINSDVCADLLATIYSWRTCGTCSERDMVCGKHWCPLAHGPNHKRPEWLPDDLAWGCPKWREKV